MNYQVPPLTFLHRFKKALTLSVMAAGLFLSTSATAGLIPLTLETEPDIASWMVSVNYDMSSKTLTADGAIQNYYIGGIENTISGIFNLSASIENDGTLNGGSLSLTNGTTTYLTGALTKLGFEMGDTTLEFLFTVGAGDYETDFGGIGATGGIILANTGFSSFSGSFDNGSGFAGTADVGVPVPEPAGLLLISSGLLGLIVSRRRRSSK